jgi:DNA-directed RNA polymerase subunit RPC12/RpoP
MEFFIKCGGNECHREFKGNTDERSWLCPYCDHEIVNKLYPFLCARLMEAKSSPDDTDWKDLFDFLLEKARLAMIENNMKRVENGLAKTKLTKLIEYEELLEKDDTDFKQKTLEAVDELGKIIISQEEEIQEEN